VDGVPKWSQQHAAFQKVPLQRRPCRSEVTAVGHFEIDGRNGPELPGIDEAGCSREGREPLGMKFPEFRDALAYRLALPYADIGERGRYADGIGRIARRVKKGFRTISRIVLFENGPCRERCGKGHGPARNALCETEDIGRDARLL